MQRVRMDLNLGHEVTEVLVRGGVDHLLHHVVGVLVLHHGVQGRAWAVRVGRAHLLDQEGSLGPVGVLDASLHHVTGDLVLWPLVARAHDSAVRRGGRCADVDVAGGVWMGLGVCGWGWGGDGDWR